MTRRIYTLDKLDDEYKEILEHSLTGQRGGRNYSPGAFETATDYYSQNPNHDTPKEIRQKLDEIKSLTNRQRAHIKRRIRFLNPD